MGFGLTKSNNKKAAAPEKPDKKTRSEVETKAADDNDKNNSASDTITAETIKVDENSLFDDIQEKPSPDNKTGSTSVELAEAEAIPVTEIIPSTEKIKLNATLPQTNKNQKSKKSKKK